MIQYGEQSVKKQLDGADFNGTIDIIHQKVHDGVFFTANYEELSVANNGEIRLRLTTGSKTAHLVINGDTEGKFRFKTYSGTTYTADGTTANGVKLTVFNRRSGGSAPVSTVRFAPTVNVLGTLRGLRTIFGGTGPQSTGGTGSDRVESILPANTDLLIVLTNVSGASKDASVVLEWYEV